MLTLTDSASTIVKSIVDQDPNVADGGLRIGSGPSERDFSVAVVSSPEPGDQTLESHGARVFVEPAASTALEDKTLDAQRGENGAITFTLLPQA